MTSLVLRKLGARKVNLPERLVQLAETDRMNLSPRLRGSKLEEWIEQWLDRNLDQKQLMTQGSLLASRFKQGKLAMPLEAIDRLFAIKDQVFADQRALDEWIGKQGFSPELAEKISQGVPPTKRAADDVVVALDLRNGTLAWKTTLSGLPTGRTSSSTPCLANERIFAIGGKRIFCLDTKTGKLIWETEIHQKEWPAPSLLRWEDFCLNRKFASLRREVRSLALGKQAGQRKHRFPRTLENRQFHPDRL